MKSLLPLVTTALLCAASLPAHAVQTDIKVWADVDTTLALLKADGSALTDVVRMSHNPANGLTPWNEQVRIFSNDTSRNVGVRLANDAVLTPTVAATGAVPVPLTISLNKQTLTVAAQEFKASDLFDGAIPGASIAMELRIAQATPGKITAAGLYEGIVSVVMAQTPAPP